MAVDEHLEQRTQVHDQLKKLMAELPPGATQRKANGLLQASIAIADAIINLVPACEEQSTALDALQILLDNSMIAFRTNPVEKDE